MQFDDVHCRHGQPRSVDHAADVAVEGDVVEFEFLCFVFALVFLRRVTHFGEVFVAVEGVVVDADFGIKRQQFAVTGDDERVDFDHAQVFVDEEGVEALQQGGELADLFFVEVHGEAEAAANVGEIASSGADADAVDFFRAFFGDFFDVHAAFGAGNDGYAFAGAINHDGKVEFFDDVETFFDENFMNGQADVAGLSGFQGAANHLAGVLAHFIQAFGDFDAAGLAASAGVYLGFDDPNVATQSFGSGDGFIRAVRELAARGIHAIGAKERFGLVFV